MGVMMNPTTTTFVLFAILGGIAARQVTSDGEKKPTCGHFHHYRHSGENIVGGRRARQGEVPWQLRMIVKGKDGRLYQCGATLVDSSHAITAAHCLFDKEGYRREIHSVTAGVINFNSDWRHIQVREAEALEHPNYGNGYEHEDDIAILWFWKPFVLNKWVQPACLPTKNTQLSARDKLRVSGFGRTDPNDKDSTSSHLILVDVPYINDRSCQSYLDKYGMYKLMDKMFCAGLSKGGKDACQGDSGGPAVKIEKNKATLVGVVSFGDGCAEPGKPGLYTRVSNYLDWIEENLQ